MPDLDELIDRLESEVRWGDYYSIEAIQNATKDLVDAVYELLEDMKTASEPVEPVLYTSEDKTIWSSWYICGACQNPVECWDKFCRNCGKPIKWEGSEANAGT